MFNDTEMDLSIIRMVYSGDVLQNILKDMRDTDHGPALIEDTQRTVSSEDNIDGPLLDGAL